MSSPIGAFLSPPGYAGPRGLRPLVRESTAALELARSLHRRARRARARSAPFTTGPVRAAEPVLLVPGFMAGDLSLRLMADFLREDGFRTYRAHIRANTGCTRQAADLLERRLESIALKRGRRVWVVGHSLGGLLARGLAVRRPDLVAGVVTLGSPMLAPGAVHTLLAWDAEALTRLSRAGWRGLMGADCVAGSCARDSWEECRRPVPAGVGFTAVYSRRDGIVDWRGCVDPAARRVEVTTSHLGMAVDPTVLGHVAEALRLTRAVEVEAGVPVGDPSGVTAPGAVVGAAAGAAASAATGPQATAG